MRRDRRYIQFSGTSLFWLKQEPGLVRRFCADAMHAVEGVHPHVSIGTLALVNEALGLEVKIGLCEGCAGRLTEL